MYNVTEDQREFIIAFCQKINVFCIISPDTAGFQLFSWNT